MSPLRAADPAPLSCPNGQTVFIKGRAPANEALLVYMGGRAVGGGVADRSGAYSLPIRPQEKPGSYAVEVRLRSNRSVVERFTCFVDVPVGAESASPTPAARAATPGPAQPTAQAASPTRAITQTPRATGTAPTATPSGSPTITPTGPTATVTTTRTPGPSPTATATLRPGQASPTPRSTASAQIVDIVLIDPAFPNSSEEYVQIRNVSNQAVPLIGWRLINTSRPDSSRGVVPAFVFPDYSLDVDVTIAVFSAVGEPDLELGDFYWNQQGTVWKAGDKAELRDAQNNLIHSFTVSSDQ